MPSEPPNFYRPDPISVFTFVKLCVLLLIICSIISVAMSFYYYLDRFSQTFLPDFYFCSSRYFCNVGISELIPVSFITAFFCTITPLYFKKATISYIEHKILYIQNKYAHSEVNFSGAYLQLMAPILGCFAIFSFGFGYLIFFESTRLPLLLCII